MKTWIVTGAWRGFGLRIAKPSLEQGDHVIVTARNTNAMLERSVMARALEGV
ncbi:hypothetical protein [Erythrobacter sp.]|uniref:hypothetical protein n=1 Tax=Erythrobacter sp. TaxID=1042 RepID=UPI00311D76DF